jgi:hypothetical protein
MSSSQDVQSGDRAKTGADGQQRRPQSANVGKTIELIEGGIHVYFLLNIWSFLPPDH